MNRQFEPMVADITPYSCVLVPRDSVEEDLYRMFATQGINASMIGGVLKLDVPMYANPEPRVEQPKPAKKAARRGRPKKVTTDDAN